MCQVSRIGAVSCKITAMLQSKLFTKTRKEAPADEAAKNAKLLIRAGYIHKEMAGVYDYLPLGLRVLNKISNIIRQEMNAIGGEELLLTSLQEKIDWERSGRWSDEVVDNWFKTKLKNGSEVGLAFTHEEPLSVLMREYVHSFRDLPIYVYQIQNKFRNETRAKSGIMRAREFLMKDLYSFSRDETEHNAFYEKAKGAYVKIFKRLGLGDKTYVTFASGGTFSKYSHEFQTVTETGEDVIHICEKCHTAINDDIFAEQSICPDCGNKNFEKKKAVEVGNIFTLGSKFSHLFNLKYQSEKKEDDIGTLVFMGSYGIGLGRLIGTIVEVFADDRGLVWPESVAPFKVHLLSLASGKDGTKKAADKLYRKLLDGGAEVLYDDRDARAGEKFADSDLLGLPVRLVVSDKTVKAGKIEFKLRTGEKSELLDEKEVIKKLTDA